MEFVLIAAETTQLEAYGGASLGHVTTNACAAAARHFDGAMSKNDR